jgi:hypothetical protein
LEYEKCAICVGIYTLLSMTKEEAAAKVELVLPQVQPYPLSWGEYNLRKGWQDIQRTIRENRHGLRGSYLFLALAYSGFELGVRLLLEMGVDIEMKSTYMQQTALILAARGGHTDVVKLLAAHRANINATDKYGGTPLIWAVHKDQPSMVRLLLTLGADRELRNIVSKNAWEYARTEEMKGLFKSRSDIL